MEDRAQAFARDGYLILDGLLTQEELDGLRAESVRLCRTSPGLIDGAEPLPPGITDEDVLRRFLCIHFPHKISAVMAELMAHPAVVPVLRDAVGPDVKAMQSMLFIKAEGKPGQAWHQDEYFIPTRDRSLAAIWIAIDDATVDNGCLWVLPGSHRPGRGAGRPGAVRWCPSRRTGRSRTPARRPGHRSSPCAPRPRAAATAAATGHSCSGTRSNAATRAR